VFGSDEIVISDEEEPAQSRRQKEGRKGSEIVVDDAKQYADDDEEEEDELKRAINLSLNTSSLSSSSTTTATNGRPRRGTNERGGGGESGGIETRLRSRKQSRREREQREKELREEEERARRELLREEQNREFQESLMRDQVIEEAKAAEERRAREAEEHARADEERQRREAETRERDRERMYAELKHRFDTKDQQQQQTTSPAGRREVALVLRMANGERLPQRIFYADELLDEVRQYATLQLLERDRYSDTRTAHAWRVSNTRVIPDVFLPGRPNSTLCLCATSPDACCTTSRARSLTAGSTSAPSSASPMPTSPSRPLLLRRRDLRVLTHTKLRAIDLFIVCDGIRRPSTLANVPRLLWLFASSGWSVVVVDGPQLGLGPTCIKTLAQGAFRAQEPRELSVHADQLLECPCSRNVIRCR
jgi:hypothetical protein